MAEDQIDPEHSADP